MTVANGPALKKLTTPEQDAQELFEFKRDVYQHPAAEHIPKKWNIARAAKGFPWRAVGGRIWLMMMKGQERVSDGGIVLPNVGGSRGKDKELTMGIVVTHGAGEIVAHGMYSSPEFDYNIIVGDVVFIEPNSGQIVHDEEHEYRVISTHDIVGIGKRDVGQKVRNQMLADVAKILERYQKNPDEALSGTAPKPTAPLPERPSYEMEVGDAQETIATQKGKATKTAFPVDPKLKPVIKD